MKFYTCKKILILIKNGKKRMNVYLFNVPVYKLTYQLQDGKVLLPPQVFGNGGPEDG